MGDCVSGYSDGILQCGVGITLVGSDFLSIRLRHILIETVGGGSSVAETVEDKP